MCNGPTHAVGGVAFGFAAADLYNAVAPHPLSLPAVIAVGGLAAGGALLNDLDHPGSTATHSGGWATEKLSNGVRRLSQYMFDVSATKYDHGSRRITGTHRCLTHTVLFTMTAGLAIAGLSSIGWPVMTLVIAAVLYVGFRGLFPKKKYVTISAILAVVVAGVIALLVDSPPLVGCSITVGMLSHIALDGCTTVGVPALWPFKIRGQRWCKLGTPRFLRFPTGGRVEVGFRVWWIVVTPIAFPPIFTLLERALGIFH